MYSDFVADLLKMIAHHVNEKVEIKRQGEREFYDIYNQRFFSDCELQAILTDKYAQRIVFDAKQ